VSWEGVVERKPSPVPGALEEKMPSKHALITYDPYYSDWEWELHWEF